MKHLGVTDGLRPHKYSLHVPELFLAAVLQGDRELSPAIAPGPFGTTLAAAAWDHVYAPVGIDIRGRMGREMPGVPYDDIVPGAEFEGGGLCLGPGVGDEHLFHTDPCRVLEGRAFGIQAHAGKESQR